MAKMDITRTEDEINQAVNECAGLKQAELHILAWQWEMGLGGPNNDARKGGLMHEAAKVRGVKLMPLQIPRVIPC